MQKQTLPSQIVTNKYLLLHQSGTKYEFLAIKKKKKKTITNDSICENQKIKIKNSK